MINGSTIDDYFDFDVLSEVNNDFWNTNHMNFKCPADIQKYYSNVDSEHRMYTIFKQDNNKPYLAKIYVFEGFDNWIHIKLPNKKFMRRNAKSISNHQMLNKYLYHFQPIFSMFQDYTQMTFYNESRIYFKFYAVDFNKKNIMLSFVFGIPYYDD